MTREDADRWVGKTIWQIAADGTPIAFEVIGKARRPGFSAHEPNRFCLHLLQDGPASRPLSWDSSAPAFASRELAREYALTGADRARLAKIKSDAYARRGFGGPRVPRPQPIALDLFTFAAEMTARRAWPSMGAG